jgi:hypothetical protein
MADEETKKPPILSMDQVMRLQLPPEARAALEQLDKDHVENYRLHPDEVAVCEVSMETLDRLDGIPGFYDVVTGTLESLEKGLSDKAEFTPQGLRIVDRFKTEVNILPIGEWCNEWIIVPLKDWQESRSAQSGMALMESSTGVAGLMRRQGDG